MRRCDFNRSAPVPSFGSGMGNHTKAAQVYAAQSTKAAQVYDAQPTNDMVGYLSALYSNKEAVQGAFSMDSHTAIHSITELCSEFQNTVNSNQLSLNEAHELKALLDCLIDLVFSFYQTRDRSVASRIHLYLRGVRREIAALFWTSVEKSPYASYL